VSSRQNDKKLIKTWVYVALFACVEKDSYHLVMIVYSNSNYGFMLHIATSLINVSHWLFLCSGTIEPSCCSDTMYIYWYRFHLLSFGIRRVNIYIKFHAVNVVNYITCTEVVAKWKKATRYAIALLLHCCYETTLNPMISNLVELLRFKCRTDSRT